MAALEAAPIFLLLYSAAAKPAMSTSPKHLLLVKVITTNIPVNRWLENCRQILKSVLERET